MPRVGPQDTCKCFVLWFFFMPNFDFCDMDIVAWFSPISMKSADE